MHHTNKAAPAASTTYKSEDTPPLASATRKSQHHHYSTTTHHHFVTINNGPQNLTPARLEMLPPGNQLESQRNSAWRRLCLPPCDGPSRLGRSGGSDCPDHWVHQRGRSAAGLAGAKERRRSREPGAERQTCRAVPPTDAHQPGASRGAGTSGAASAGLALVAPVRG
jgi:hypothetical protein